MEQHELRPTIDYITEIIAERGGKVDVKPSSRRFPTFSEYVIRPGRFYFSLGFISVLSLSTALMIWFDLYMSFKYWLVAFFISITIGVIAYSYVASMLTDEWRNLINGKQNDIHIEAGMQSVERPLVTVAPGQKLMSSIPWKPHGLERLAKRVEGMRAGDRFTRDLITGLIVNPTRNFPLAAAEFVKWGWLNKVNDAYYWTERGLKELRENTPYSAYGEAGNG